MIVIFNGREGKIGLPDCTDGRAGGREGGREKLDYQTVHCTDGRERWRDGGDIKMPLKGFLTVPNVRSLVVTVSCELNEY